MGADCIFSIKHRQETSMLQKKTTKEILEENLSRKVSSGMSSLKIWLHNIRSLHNTGSVFRSCDAFGAGEIFLSGYTPVPPRPEITKTALGAEEFVRWRYVENPIKEIEQLKQNGYTVAGIEQSFNSLLLNQFLPKPEQKLCLILGNEVTGIDEEILPHLDLCLEIPQFGKKHSLNVSVTAGIVLYHFMKAFEGC